MAVVIFNKELFEKEIEKFDEKTENKIAFFGTPVEKINEKEIHLEIPPNRPDLLSYYGFKRAFLGFLEKNTGLKKYETKRPEKNFEVVVDSSVEDVRPYTACAVVKELKLDEEKIRDIIELQEKLHLTIGRQRKKAAIGVYPLEKIKLPIIFKAMEPDRIKFMPLDSNKEMSGLEILQKHSKGKEFAHLLSGKLKFPIFIDSQEQILSMPPIINSQTTGKITPETKDVFVECSGFDLNILKSCLNIVVTSLAEMGGKIYKMNVKHGKTVEQMPDLKSRKMKIYLENISKLLGIKLDEKTLKKMLEKMGYDYKKRFVEFPAWRTDILHEVDIAEDVAIAYGYDNFVPEIPPIATIGEENKKEVLKKKISDILCGLELLEVSNYHLTRLKDQKDKMGVQKKVVDFMEVSGSKTDFSILRKNLLHIMLRVLSENIDSGYPQKIFEIGKIFDIAKETKFKIIGKKEYEKIFEKEALAVAISPGNYTELRQIIEYLFRMLDKEIIFKETENVPEHFIEGRTAEIIFNGKSIGFIGEIHPKILYSWKIKMPVAILEIEIDEVLNELTK